MNSILVSFDADTQFIQALLDDQHGMKALPHRNLGGQFTQMLLLAQSVPGVRVGRASSLASAAQFIYVDDRAAIEDWVAQRAELRLEAEKWCGSK